MALSDPSPIYEDLVAFLVEKATPEAILSFTASEVAQERAADLIERKNDGTLTQKEAIELEQMLQADRFVSVLKAKALTTLHKS